jgi:primase-polymerase (primpol)-like protein
MVPREMRSLDQWCCSTADSKVPIDAKTGNAAAVNDPSTWSSYTRAVEAGYPFVGFVLSDSDPFTIIDLDPPDTKEQEDRHAKIIAALDSYTEVSKSGRGVHIIVTGSIPKGVRRDKVEIYSSHRYMITTGKSIGDRPIANRQRLLDIMFREMDTTATVELVEEDEVISDEEVVEMAMSASNADKFNRLCRGEWQGEYSSQSDADFALLAIIAYYTRSNSQVRRLFRMSALGKRDKAHRPDYLNRSLMKIRAKQPAVLDFSELDLTVPEEEIEREPYVSDFVCDQQYPSGLMGEIANYIYNTAQRPIHEAGIAAAMGLMAGIAGRAYNVSHTGLNQYIVLLAGTGSGKEGMRKRH